VGLEEMETERRGEGMKFLVVGEYDPYNMLAVFKKGKAYREDKEKHPDRYPDTIFPTHFMLGEDKYMAIWETDDPEKNANKIEFMLPEAKYEVYPLMDAKTFEKQHGRK
jgi:hypothetical protein